MSNAYWIEKANEAADTGDVEELMEDLCYYMNSTSTDDIDLTLFEMFEACEAYDLERLVQLASTLDDE